MPKPKSRYVCSECGYITVRWLGKCPECEKWNTLVEEVVQESAAPKPAKRAPGIGAAPVLVGDVPDDGMERLSTGIAEFDRVLGGGLVKGSLLLIGGDPGIGKSTLLTQTSANLSLGNERVLYISGEESARQIKLRANRLGLKGSGFYILSENDMNAIEARIDEVGPTILVVDSIQTMYRPEMSSAPGSVSQVRESASIFMRLAKMTGLTVFLVGHVTKEGSIAGPRVLEHMVDAVLYFEGDTDHQYRILRAAKNRFGSVNELGMFEMTESGMREVPNASEILISERAQGQSGSAILSALEGTRSMLMDVQALVATTVFGNPRRMASGVDQGRLALILAVLEKRAGLPLFNQDVYINVAGGLSLSEPAADLALCAAIASSLKNVALDPRVAVMGEVGLAGEVRAVSQAERRVQECARLGFTKIVLPKGNLKNLRRLDDVTYFGVETVAETLQKLIQ